MSRRVRGGSNKQQYKKKLSARDCFVHHKLRNLGVYDLNRYDNVIFREDLPPYKSYVDKQNRKVYWLKNVIEEGKIDDYLRLSYVSDGEDAIEDCGESKRWTTLDLDQLSEEDSTIDINPVVLLRRSKYSYKKMRYEGEIKKKIILSIPIMRVSEKRGLSKNKDKMNKRIIKGSNHVLNQSGGKGFPSYGGKGLSQVIEESSSSSESDDDVTMETVKNVKEKAEKVSILIPNV